VSPWHDPPLKRGNDLVSADSAFANSLWRPLGAACQALKPFTLLFRSEYAQPCNKRLQALSTLLGSSLQVHPIILRDDRRFYPAAKSLSVDDTLIIEEPCSYPLLSTDSPLPSLKGYSVLFFCANATPGDCNGAFFSAQYDRMQNDQKKSLDGRNAYGLLPQRQSDKSFFAARSG
jgi:hypothetical protein